MLCTVVMPLLALLMVLYCVGQEAFTLSPAILHRMRCAISDDELVLEPFGSILNTTFSDKKKRNAQVLVTRVCRNAQVLVTQHEAFTAFDGCFLV